MTALPDGYACVESASDCGGIRQRWLVVHSSSAAQRAEKTLARGRARRRVEKEAEAAQKAWRKLARQTFNCPADAQAALAAFHKRWKYHRAEAVITPLTRYPGPGRPATGATPDVVGYQLQGRVSQSDAALATARDCLGRFVLATTELDPDKLPPQAMLAQYKAQAISVERGFRCLKDPLLFADSLFLKNPGRIMALIMIMVLALLVYALAERQLRLRLAQEGQSVPTLDLPPV